MRAHKAELVLALSTMMLVASCGPRNAYFGTTFPDNRPRDIQAVLQRIREAKRRDDSPVMVVLSEQGRRLSALDLKSRSKLWDRDVVARSAPFVAGRSVITLEESGVVARNVEDGEEQFSVEDEALHLVGADGAGEVVVFTLSTGGGVGAHSKIVVARSGNVLWQVDVDYVVGSPAVIADTVLVPWGGQNVSIFDASNADELARVRLTDAVVGAAQVEGEEVYFGQAGVFRFTPSIRYGLKERAAYFEPKVGDLPGRPEFLPDPFRPPAEPTSSTHSVRLAWSPSGTGEHVVLADGNLYLIFYRLVFAMNPENGSVRWAYRHPHTIVGAQARPGGLFVMDSNGTAGFVHHRAPELVWSWSTGISTSVAAIRPGTWEPSLLVRGVIPPLREQLLETARDPDTRLAPARLMAVRQLALLEDPVVTDDLIGLCSDEIGSALIRHAACEALANRTTGIDYVLAALEQHASFLDERPAPPIAALSQAAVSMESVDAVPLLVAHLRDPHTAVEDLPVLIHSLGQLGNANAAPALEDFLRTYHAEQPEQFLVRSLIVAAESLVKLRNEQAKETLEWTANDPFCIREVRQELLRILSTIEPPAKEEKVADTNDESEVPAESNANATGEEKEEAFRSPLLQALDPLRPQLRDCLRKDRDHGRVARIVLAVTGEGHVNSVFVHPERLRACMEPLVRNTRFQATANRRLQRVTYLVNQ